MKKILFILLLSVKSVGATGIDLSIGQGTVAAKPIAVVPFSGNSGEDKIDYIVSSDLNQSGVFAPVSPQTYRMRPTSVAQIDYQQFRQLGVAYVVVGQLRQSVIHFALADVFQRQLVGRYKVALPNGSLRLGSHQVSDLILQKLTGTRGAFATRLVYINETGAGLSRQYRIMLSDSDGHNPVVLLSSRAPLMSPRFSPDGQHIAYVTFEGNHAQIVTHNIKSGRRTLVSRSPGINSAPAWSPDGGKIAMVLSKDGNPEIYFKDLRTERLVRVTNNQAIDTEPVWSSDGRAIYFTSNRSGSPQLYRIQLNNGAVTKVTSTGRYSAGADISKDGKRIALARNNQGRFIIGTIDRATGRFKGVSHGFVDETPRFSPNGQMLIFTSVENNREVLKIVNVDGSGTNTLSTSGQIRDPDWSSYVQ